MKAKSKHEKEAWIIDGTLKEGAWVQEYGLPLYWNCDSRDQVSGHEVGGKSTCKHQKPVRCVS